jgi:hypothetical protein
MINVDSYRFQEAAESTPLVNEETTSLSFLSSLSSLSSQYAHYQLVVSAEGRIAISPTGFFHAL